MEVQAEFIETAMAVSTSLNSPEEDVNMLINQVADGYGGDVGAVKENTTETAEDGLSRRLAELRNRS